MWPLARVVTFLREAGCFPNWKITLETACRMIPYLGNRSVPVDPGLSCPGDPVREEVGAVLQQHWEARRGAPRHLEGPTGKGQRGRKQASKEKRGEGEAGSLSGLLSGDLIGPLHKTICKLPVVLDHPDVRWIRRCLPWQHFVV